MATSKSLNSQRAAQFNTTLSQQSSLSATSPPFELNTQVRTNNNVSTSQKPGNISNAYQRTRAQQVLLEAQLNDRLKMNRLNNLDSLDVFVKSQHLENIPDRRTVANALLLPKDLSQYLLQQQAFLGRDVSQGFDVEKAVDILNEVPREFHSVYPLDDQSKQRGASGTSGYSTAAFKVVSTVDGFAYFLRRVDGIKLPINVMQDMCVQVYEL